MTHGDEATLAPAAAFATVGNKTRLAILQALFEAHDELRFSELRAEVGMKDSAQFNYHLKQLQPQFVAKTDDGYRLRFAGKRVVWAILIGTFTADVSRGPFEIGGECVSCGAGLEATYEDETLGVACGTCGRLHSKMTFPSSGLTGRSDEQLVAAYDRWVRAEYALVSGGVCSNCGGRMQTTLVPPAEVPGYACPEAGGDEEGADGFDVGVSHHCDQCDAHVGAAVGMGLLDATEVVAFYADHGIDVEDVPYWELPWTVSDRHTTVEREDPWRIVVAIPLDDEELRVTVDGDIEVVRTERRALTREAESEAEV